MTTEPFLTEQFHDSQFEVTVAHLCTHPCMYTLSGTLNEICAYLEGFDAARGGGPLLGLHPWLVVRENGGVNMGWASLAQRRLTHDLAGAESPEDRRNLLALGRLLAEFFEYRRTQGVTKIFHEYARWLLRRSWYTGPLRREKPAE